MVSADSLQLYTIGWAALPHHGAAVLLAWLAQMACSCIQEAGLRFFIIAQPSYWHLFCCNLILHVAGRTSPRTIQGAPGPRAQGLKCTQQVQEC